MSIYKERKFDLDLKKSKKPILIAVSVFLAIIIIFLIINSVNWSKLFTIKGKNISCNFKDNPLILSKKNNSLLRITVKNNTKVDAIDSRVEVIPVESNFTVFCEDAIDENNRTVIIPTIARGNRRTVTCDIRKDPSKSLLEGSYSFDIFFELNKTMYKDRVKLNVRK